HTNDAPSTVARLTEMGVEPFMISASIVCICAQRLMRRLNKNTKTEYQPEGNELEIIQNAIGYTGPVMGAGPANSPLGPPYKGRVGIHELMPTSEELVKGINDGLEAARLKVIAMRNGMRTLHQDSMLKVMDGLTSMEESLSTVPPDMEDLSEFADAV
ncbi:MAG: type II/IV secretion system protein, partial [Opitutales bacterium]|nr:type II/IV secretion system protein [Opitutales bacterium]